MNQKKETKNLTTTIFEYAKTRKMSQEKIALKEHETRLIKVQNNNTNNTQINNNNVTMNILPYEQTDVSHLFDRDYQRAFNRADQILEKVYFDPEKPQNHNVYISSTSFRRRPKDVNNKYIKLHNGERWNLRGWYFRGLHNIHRSNTRRSGGWWIQDKYGDDMIRFLQVKMSGSL